MSWDIYSKLLLKECPQDFVTYFAPGAHYVRMRETQMQTRKDGLFDPREMRGDTLIEAQQDDKHFLIDIEWQSSEDTTMDERLLGYSYEATRLHRLSVLPCVIYTQAVAIAPRAPLSRTMPRGRQLLWFDFESLEVASQSVEYLRRLNLDGFQPLMLLCQDGANYSVLEEVLARLERHQRKELISLTRFFAGKVFTSEADQERLERRFAMLRDLLEDSWTFRQTREEGRVLGEEEGIAKGIVLGEEKGLAKGRVRGQEEGRVKEARQNIESFVEEYPSSFQSWVREQIEQITDLETLRKVLRVVGRAGTEDEIKQFLLACR